MWVCVDASTKSSGPTAPPAAAATRSRNAFMPPTASPARPMRSSETRAVRRPFFSNTMPRACSGKRTLSNGAQSCRLDDINSPTFNGGVMSAAAVPANSSSLSSTAGPRSARLSSWPLQPPTKRQETPDEYACSNASRPSLRRLSAPAKRRTDWQSVRNSWTDCQSVLQNARTMHVFYKLRRLEPVRRPVKLPPAARTILPAAGLLLP